MHKFELLKEGERKQTGQTGMGENVECEKNSAV